MPEIIFILYKPAVPGNVGASARAIKTMGFSHLRLIKPCDHLNMDARMMAHGSHDILEQASIYESYEQSVQDLDYIICTTAKSRSAKYDYYSSQELGKVLSDKAGNLDKIGVVFGTEESGLPNSIIQHADLAVTVPMASTYPSLNLSQSVMILSYELSLLDIPENIKPAIPAKSDSLREIKQDKSVKPESFRELKQKTRELLEDIGVKEGTPLHHRIMERVAILKSGDISLMHAVTSKISKHFIHKKSN